MCRPPVRNRGKAPVYAQKKSFYELKARVHTKILYVSMEKIAKFHAGEILLAGCRDEVRQAARTFVRIIICIRISKFVKNFILSAITKCSA